MRALIETIARSIVTDENTLHITETSGRYQTTLTVNVAEADVGKLIGRKGRTIRAIRDLVDLMSEDNLCHYTIWVQEVSVAACAAAK